MMKTELRLVLALFAAAVLAATAEAFVDTGSPPSRDAGLIDLHRSIHVQAGHCLACQGASYDRLYYCRPGLRCVAFDRAQIDAFESPIRRAARRPSLTPDRRTECASENS
ncbi:MAG TPA: hypothetical protein VEW72_14075 [Burkholderiales bacterium]|nr:hypothetical protein [Burkholderiales bacterium]